MVFHHIELSPILALTNYTKQWIQRQLVKNVSFSSIIGYPATIDQAQYMSDLCSPSHCTISSFCQASYTKYFFTPGAPVTLPEYNQDEACCSGGSIRALPSTDVTSLASSPHPTCSTFNGILKSSTCDVLGFCELSPDTSDFNYYCYAQAVKSNQWIGIVLTLLGMYTHFSILYKYPPSFLF
jgi:hypothetical protein